MNTLRVVALPLCIAGLLQSSASAQIVGGPQSFGSPSQGSGATQVANGHVFSSATSRARQSTKLVLPLSDALQSKTEAISVSEGGVQRMFLDAGAAHADELYFMAGSLSGTWPGLVTQGGQIIPLNPDIYLQLTVIGPNPQLENQVGVLDRGGKAQAGFKLQPSRSALLVGLEVNHAFVTIDVRQGRITAASNALAVRLVP